MHSFTAVALLLAPRLVDALLPTNHGTPFQQTVLNKLNPYPNKPKLVFRADSSFKLLVMSDLHFGENAWDSWGPEQDLNSTRVMRRVLKDERPSYVAITGDLITGENTFAENSTKYIDMIAKPLNQARVPFSSIHGNHDNQINITHAAEIAREQKVAPLSYTRSSPADVGGEQGPGNYWVPIYHRHEDHSPALILWFFDSRGGVTANSTFDNQTNLPDWVDESVAGWLRSELKAQERAWGPPTARASLAFVHIPPHIVEYLQVTLNSTESPGLNAGSLGTGSTQSTIRTDMFGTGRDAPFWSALTELPNLVSVVSGHDHGCEWCSLAPISGTPPSNDTDSEETETPGEKKLRFCFAKHTGYGGYGDTEWGYGVRLFEFKPEDERGNTGRNWRVKTWIRLEEGETRAKMDLGRVFA